MGETRVDLLHLLEDLRDAYPGSLEETILTEIVANARDSGATRVAFVLDPGGPTLTVVDDGSGMKRRALARYQDLAATTKVRGQGIGFAGVGIKLGLLVAEEVLTETRRGTVHVASSWRLASRQRAPWRWVPPPGLVGEHGTAVRLRLQNPLSPLLDAGFLAACLERQFEPLLDPAFDEVLAPYYPRGVALVVNGVPLPRRAPDPARAPLTVRLGRRRRPVAVGYLVRAADLLPEEARGVAVSTLGKVITRGWDWIGLAPASPDRVAGLLEAPALAACLTLNKSQFVRAGARGALYLAYRKAIQEAVSVQLAAWGETPDRAAEARRRARPVELDLRRVLAELAREFPLLATLVTQEAGGQGRLPMGSRDGVGALAGPLRGEAPEAAEPPAAPTARGAQTAAESPRVAPDAETAASPPGAGAPPAAPPLGPRPARASGRERPGRFGLSLAFESRAGDPALGRLVESTVWVNDAHPAYRRAVASRSEGYHLALTVAMALAPLAAAPEQTHAFVTTFLARWGEAVGHGDGRGRGRPGRGPGRRG